MASIRFPTAFNATLIPTSSALTATCGGDVDLAASWKLMSLSRVGLRPLGLSLRAGLSSRVQSTPSVFLSTRTQCLRSSFDRIGRLDPTTTATRIGVQSVVLRALTTSARSRSPVPSSEPPSQPGSQKKITQAVAALHATQHGDKRPALSEDILTIPNALTASRLLMVPAIGWMIVHGHMLSAAGLLFAAGVTDVLDGWIARRTGRLTVFGSIADPAADKGLMATMVICLGVSGLLPLPLVALILVRDVGLVLSAFVIRYRTLPPPKTVARYFDPSLPSVMAKPTQLSKYNTFLQLLLVGLATILPAIPQASAAASAAGLEASHPMLDTLFTWLNAAFVPFQYIVAATTAISGLQYLTGAGVSRVTTASAAALSNSKPKVPTAPSSPKSTSPSSPKSPEV